MLDYTFVTNWSFNAPVEQVWHEIIHPLQWPQWWRGVEQVEQLEPGGVDGLGSLHRSVWKSVLPYRLRFDSRAMRVERYRIYEIQAMGQLEGAGLWSFSQTGDITQVRYDWNVTANKLWMRVLAPIARPIFRWNHDVIMRWGEEGLAKRLAGGGRGH